MTQAVIRAAVVAVTAGFVLAGCESGGGASMGASDAAGAPVARAAMPGRLVERDVEAPEVFQATDQALWDGRPSLGGVWVASPETVDPERVIIRNPDNGNFVIGALFRRERLNPGPTLQISSDAAAALGILAGAPTRIEVVALRRSEPEAPVAEAEVADAAPASEETVPDGGGDDIGAAAVAVLEGSAATAEVASAEAGADLAATAADVPDTGAGAGEMAALPAVSGEADTPPRKKRKWFWQKNRTEEPVPAALSVEDGEDVVAAVPAVETSAIAATALPAPGASVDALPAVAGAAAPSASAGGRLIQIGFFSVEENAQRAVDKLGASGIPARVLTEQAKGKTFWRVVAGPGADAGLLGKVKSAGFADAYFVQG